MFDNNGEIGAPLRAAHPLVLVPGRPMAVPLPSVSSTGASSHILISRRTRPSLIRRDTDFINSAWGMLSKYPDKSASTTSVCPDPEQPFDVANGVQGAASRAVGVLFRLQVGLEDRLQDQHRRHLHHAIFDARNAQRPLLAIRLWGCTRVGPAGVDTSPS